MLNRIKKESYEGKVAAYASMLFQLCHDVEPWQNEIDCAYAWYAHENPVEANKLLHTIHQEYPDIRQDAIRKIADTYDMSMRVIFHKIVVESIDKVRHIPIIDKFLDSLSDDVVYSYGTTYYNDHNMRRLGMCEENATVLISVADKQTFDYIQTFLKEKFGDDVEIQ